MHAADRICFRGFATNRCSPQPESNEIKKVQLKCLKDVLFQKNQAKYKIVFWLQSLKFSNSNLNSIIFENFKRLALARTVNLIFFCNSINFTSELFQINQFFSFF